MLRIKKNRYFSFLQLFRFLALFSLVIQLVVISYNHFSGYFILDDFRHFIFKLIIGTGLSIVAAFLMVYPDLWMIRFLNSFATWNKKVFIRIVLQAGFIIIIASIIAIIFTIFSNWLFAYYRDSLQNVIINNILIFAIVNLVLVIILEAWIYFIESKRAKQEAQTLKEELSQIKFEVLKSQINPHFMFNSLNVLSGLIGKDTQKAQQFIDEFSYIYRYVLESIEKPVATLEKELEFVRSYLFLQQIRYGSSLSWSIKIPSEILSLYMPPLSLQVVLENAIKHNIINKNKPLHIDLYNEDLFLFIRNNIQLKISAGKSTGLGLKNLAKRYALISDVEPVFYVDTKHYIARLPLIKTE